MQITFDTQTSASEGFCFVLFCFVFFPFLQLFSTTCNFFRHSSEKLSAVK